MPVTSRPRLRPGPGPPPITAARLAQMANRSRGAGPGADDPEEGRVLGGCC